MTDVEIRPATEADLPAVLGLYGQPALDDGQVLGVEEAKGFLERFAAYPDYTLYVAIADGEVVGTFSLLVMDNFIHLGSPSGIVEAVAVRPDHQGQGVGKQMMEYAMQHCRERGCYKLVLSSNLIREDAHRFYDGLGFERYGVAFRVFL